MTIRQKQLLLAYLEYYTGEIDGNYGAETIRAVKAFQGDYGLTVDGDCGAMTQKMLRGAVAGTVEKKQSSYSSSVSSSVSSGDSKGWKYFSYAEVKCKCGGKYCQQDTKMSDMLMGIADQVREHFGVPITVSSGIRCQQWNAIQGGVSNSKHITGQAIDFSVQGKSASEVVAYVKTIPGIAYTYAINDNYVHMNV